jgi:hypothetical protein
MGRKGKRRKRPRARERAAPLHEREAGAVEDGAEEPAPPEPAEKAEPEERAAPRQRGGLFSGLSIPSPHPPLGETLLRGVPPVADPRVLAVAFLFVLALWGLITALGSEAPPALMSGFWAVPPISLFFDANVVSSVVPDALGSLGLLVAVLALRSACTTAVIRWIGGELEADADDAPTGGRRGMASTALSMFAIHSAELGLVLIVFTLAQGFLGPQIGALLAWGLGIYFLGFVPSVVAVEGASAAEGLRRGLRAARLPGARHLSLVMLYLLVTLWLSQFAPGGPLPPATPSIGIWAYTLVATSVHLAALGAITYRWIVVRGVVPAGPAPRRRQRDRAA